MKKTITELRTKLAEMTSEVAELVTRDDADMSAEDADRFDYLEQRIPETREQIADIETRIQNIKATARDEQRPTARNSEQRSAEYNAAMRHLDANVKADILRAESASTVERLMGKGNTAARTWTERWAASAGSPEYTRAFAKLAADPHRGHMLFTPEEAEAFRAVQSLNEERAMSVGGSGQYIVPTHLDPAIVLSNGGSNNPLRAISRVVTTTSDSWNGVTSAGATAEWTAEATEFADGSPTLAPAPIPVHKGDVFVPYSFELEGDGLSFVQQLQGVLADAAEQQNATAYTTGNGSTAPKGIITSLVASAGSVPLISPTTAETFAAADIYKVQNALPARFSANAKWNAHLATLNSARQFETINGSIKFPELTQNPPMLLGRPVFENSNMDGVLNAAATESNYNLLYGDFSQFVIVDRVGSTVEIVQHLVGDNRRPTGQRGMVLWYRTGSDVLVPNAFRLLNIATTA
ncbi:phage major capsid protein [Nocardia sp. NPDC055165]